MRQTSYDEISDTLYISYEPDQEATGIELNEHILLRIDEHRRKLVGITVFDYSIVAQRAEMGPRSFPLMGLRELPLWRSAAPVPRSRRRSLLTSGAQGGRFRGSGYDPAVSLLPNNESFWPIGQAVGRYLR